MFVNAEGGNLNASGNHQYKLYGTTLEKIQNKIVINDEIDKKNTF
jgi:hypothetical protein